MRDVLYLDFNATTPVAEEVFESMRPYFSEHFGNAASSTHAFGWRAREAVERAEAQVARILNCSEQEIVFTSGATESVNLALKGVFERYASKGKHLITVRTEHKAVLDTCRKLEDLGGEITYLDVDRHGLINLEELKAALRRDTILVSVMLVNNETGVIQPIREIANLVHEADSILMSDATQAIGKIPVDVQDLGIDLLALSAHKFYGPKGVGALYVRRRGPRVSLTSQIDGGGHQRGRRSGTLNVPGIVGLGSACELATREMAEAGRRIGKLRDLLEETIRRALPDTRVNGGGAPRLYNTSNLCFLGLRSADILRSTKTVLAAATGSACTSEDMQPSHVLAAMGLSPDDSYSSMRFSLGRSTEEEALKDALKDFTDALSEIKHASERAG